MALSTAHTPRTAFLWGQMQAMQGGSCWDSKIDSAQGGPHQEARKSVEQQRGDLGLQERIGRTPVT